MTDYVKRESVMQILYPGIKTYVWIRRAANAIASLPSAPVSKGREIATKQSKQSNNLQLERETVVCCKDSDSNGLPMTLICNPKCRRVAAPQQQAGPVSEEREAEMRQIIMSAVALGVAAERKGLYKGSAWAADAVMEEVTNLLRALPVPRVP